MTSQRTETGIFSAGNRQRILPLVFLVGIVCCLAYLWLEGDPVPIDQKVYATVLGLLAILPMVHYLGDGRDTLVPFMAFNCLFYFATFAVNGYFWFQSHNQVLNSIPKSGWIGGLQIAIVGLLAQIAAYYLVRSVVRSARPIRVVGQISVDRMRILGWLLVASRFIPMVLPGELGSSFVLLFTVASFVGYGILMMLASYRSIVGIESSLLYYVAIPVELAYRLSTGAVFEPVLMLLFLFYVRWIVTRKINWVLVALFLAMFAIFNPIKSQYRAVVWRTTEGQSMPVIERVSLFVSLAGEFWFTRQVATDDVRSNLMERLNHLVLAAHVTNTTPDEIPYWYGETLTSAGYVFIPRVLWPDKPSLTFGVQFGHRYGMLDVSNTSTTVNLTWVTELYANFGYFGVIVGMALIGVAFALMERWFATPGTSRIDLIIPLATNFPLIYPESNIVMMWGSVITCTVAFYAIAWAFKR
jgi:hypothetical protein